MFPLLSLIPHFLFAFLASFELLNFAKILQFKLHFSWLAMAVPAILGWLTWFFLNRALKKSGSQYLAVQAGALMLISLYIDLLGNLTSFYGQWFWYDKFAHFFGGVSTVAVLFALLQHWQKLGKIRLPLVWLAIFAISLSMLAGMLYEFEEYFEDYFTGTDKIGNRFDTADDLLYQSIGASITAGALTFFIKRKNNKKQF